MILSKTPLQPDDLFRLRFINSACLHPDGNQIVYSLAEVNPETQKECAHLYVQSTATGVMRQMTFGSGMNTQPKWSPDGRFLFFLSTRGGTSQIYRMDLSGGDPRCFETPGINITTFACSPDGQSLAFSATPAQPPVDVNKPYRVTRPGFRFDGMNLVENSLADLYLLPVEGGIPRRLTQDGYHNSLIAWSPDSQSILYLAFLPPDSLEVFYPHLRILSLTGEMTDLLGDWGYAWGANWLPDGRRIVFRGSSFESHFATKNDLWVIGKDGQGLTCRTAGMRDGIGHGIQADMPYAAEFVGPSQVLVSAGGDFAYHSGQNGGSLQLYRIALEGEEVWEPVVIGERSALPLGCSRERVFFASSDLNHPLEIWACGLDGQDASQLTHHNDALLSARALPDIVHLAFTSLDGAGVEGWVLLPPIGQPPYPAVLYNHGGPHYAFGHIFSFDLQMLAGAGFAVLIINQRGSTGYGDEFAMQIIGDWGNLDYHDLMAGVDCAIQRGLIDPDRMGVCGLSAGGYLTTWIIGQTDRFKAAVPENPITNALSFYGTSDIGPWFSRQELGGDPKDCLDVYLRCSPIIHAHRCKTPTLLIQGEEDYRCPAEQSEQYYTALKANGCTVEMLRLPHSSHGGSIVGAPMIRRAQNEALLNWMKRYILEDR